MKSSQYRGVNWHAPTRNWLAQIKIDRVKEHIGYFKIEYDAARAYDARAREELGASAVTNFNELGVRNEGVGTQTSNFKGVEWHKSTGKWRARIAPPGGKSTHIGLFDSEVAAARKYDDVSESYGRGRLNFPALRPDGLPELTDAEYLAAQGGIDDADDLPRLKKRRKAAREAKNESLAKWLTVHIIFEKKMRKTTKQADLIGLWLERDAALEDPVEWVRLRARARGRSGS